MANNFQELLNHELADLYDAEQQILRTLPKLINAVTSPDLKRALKEHRVTTETQVQRLNEIFGEIGKPKEETCEGMQGLLAESARILHEDLEPHVLDAAIIGACQKVEHYEIAGYGTARAFALHLGNERAVELLQETLDEEKEADVLLTQVTETALDDSRGTRKPMIRIETQRREPAPTGGTQAQGSRARKSSN